MSKNKILQHAIFLILALVLVTNVSALSLLAEFDNGFTTKTIDPGQSAQYSVAVIGDQNMNRMTVSAKMYDFTTGEYINLGTLFSQSTTNLFYFPDPFTLSSSNYNNLPGDYLIDIKAEEWMNSGEYIVRSEQLYLDVTGNRLPTVFYTYTPLNPETNEVIQFTAFAHDDDGYIVNYDWYADGTLLSQHTNMISHSFATAGNHIVKVKVTDNDGGQAEYQQTIYVSQGYVNQPPYFTSTPITTGTVGVQYVYDANAADPDNDVLVYSLYQKPNGMSINSQTGVITWTPSSTGTFPVTVRVTDNINNPVSQTYSIVVGPAANVAPVAQFTYTPANPMTGQNVYFDGTSSYDPDGTIVSYLWKINGATVGTQSTLNHIFTTAGTYTVSLKVTDNRGLSDTETKQIVVTQMPVNQPPYFTSTPITTGTVGVQYVYDANAVDPEGDTLVYGLSQKPTGMTINSQTGLITWAPSLTGNFNVKVSVTDNINSPVYQSYTIVVEPAPNVPPVAQFNYTPLNPMTGQNVHFDGTSSYDSDGTIVSYQWKINGLTLGTQPTLNHVFNTAGTYTVSLKVTDNGGLSDTETKQIVVSQTPVNQPPVAIYNYTPSQPLIGEQVSFDASDSYDVDGTIVEYKWTLNNQIIGSGEYFQKTFNAAGNYDVYLKVTDDDGASATTHHLIQVVEPYVNQPPVAEFTWSPTTPEVGELTTFDASASYDPDGQIVSYYWTINNAFVSSQKIFTHTFNAAGAYSVKLVVTDNEGATASKTKTVNVNPQPIPGLLIDELGCNPDVVQGHEQHCSAHVKDDIENVEMTFKYSYNNEVLGTCNTNFKGYCHINPIINKPVGDYEVYVEARKTGYTPDLSRFLRTSFTVWTERYEILNLQTFNDTFITQEDTFYRANPMYAAFDVKDTFTGQYISPNSGLIDHVFLRVNNADPLNFTGYEYLELQMKVVGTNGPTSSVGDWKYQLGMIPISDDYLGEGKVFAFVFNFTDNTAGQESANVLILNNELQFNPPAKYELENGTSVTIDMKNYLSDVETPVDEIIVSSTTQASGLTVQNLGNSVFKITAAVDFEGEQTIFFKADDTDGSVVTKGILFVVNMIIPPQGPVAILKIPESAKVGDSRILDGSESYDPSGAGIVLYNWKIFLRGNLIESYTTVDSSISHTFDITGPYDVELEVVNADGLKDTDKKSIFIGRRSNIPSQGAEDGLNVEYIEIIGHDWDSINTYEPFEVRITVSNNKGERVDNLRGTFEIPELGFKVKGMSFDLRNDRTHTTVIYSELPFAEGEIPPGEYIALVGVSNSDIIRTKYFPLIIN